MPGVYERLLVPTLFEPYARDLAGRVRALAPRRILELAAGTGVLTRALDAGDVVATDFNPGMVDVGRASAPAATWQQADAMQLPFDDGAFDLVVCQFGVMFFPDKAAAFAEAARVMAPGAAFLFNTWDAIATHAYDNALLAGLARAYPENPPTFIAKVPHGYHDPEVVTADLHAGGFASVTAERLVLDGPAASAADVARGFCTGSPVKAEIDARKGDVERTISIVTEEMAAVVGAGPGPVTGSMSAFVFEARV